MIYHHNISIYHNVPNNDMTFHTNWGSTTSGSKLLCTRATARLTINGPTGNVGIGITNPFAPLCIGTPESISDGALVISSRTAAGNRNFRMGYDGSFNFSTCFLTITSKAISGVKRPLLIISDYRL